MITKVFSSTDITMLWTALLLIICKFFGVIQISILKDAFYQCTSLTSIDIHYSVSSIGDFAFQSCLWLIVAVNSDSVTSVGVGTFDHCTSLTAIIADRRGIYYNSFNGVPFWFNIHPDQWESNTTFLIL